VAEVLVEKKRILLVGGSGFIGRNIADHLAMDSYEVITPRTKEFWPAWDIHSQNDRMAILTKFAPVAVVNAGWCTKNRNYRESPDNHLWSASTLELYREAAISGVAQFISLGTFSETEGDIFSGDKSDISKYAEAKRNTLESLIKLSQHINLNFSWLKIGYPYGLYDKSDRLIPSMVHAVLHDISYEIKSPKTLLRPINVIDIAESVRQGILGKMSKVSEIYGESTYSISEIYEMIVSFSSDPFKGDMLTPPLTDGPWRTQIPFEEGIRRYISWRRAQEL